MTTQPIIYTAQQVAEVLQVGLRTVERLTASGELPCRRIGRLVRYTPDDIQALIASKEPAAKPAAVVVIHPTRAGRSTPKRTVRKPSDRQAG